MPPKKKTGSTTDGEGAEGGKFTWEGPNDTKLLLLTHGRYVKTDEYDSLATAMGTSNGSIRNRMFALRVKQRNLYEDLGWDVPEGGATRKKETPKTPKKRAAGEDGDEGTPSKKSRAKKVRKEVTPEVEQERTPESENAGAGVKEEGVEI